MASNVVQREDSMSAGHSPVAARPLRQSAKSPVFYIPPLHKSRHIQAQVIVLKQKSNQPTPSLGSP